MHVPLTDVVHTSIFALLSYRSNSLGLRAISTNSVLYNYIQEARKIRTPLIFVRFDDMFLTLPITNQFQCRGSRYQLYLIRQASSEIFPCVGRRVEVCRTVI
jgi:hypothetical protein